MEKLVGPVGDGGSREVRLLMFAVGIVAVGVVQVGPVLVVGAVALGAETERIEGRFMMLAEGGEGSRGGSAGILRGTRVFNLSDGS